MSHGGRLLDKNGVEILIPDEMNSAMPWEKEEAKKLFGKTPKSKFKINSTPINVRRTK